MSGDLFVGDVAGRAVILYDDMIATGTTLCRAAAKCREAGAAQVFAAATHGVFTGDAASNLGAAGFDEIVVCDTVRAFWGGDRWAFARKRHDPRLLAPHGRRDRPRPCRIIKGTVNASTAANHVPSYG